MFTAPEYWLLLSTLAKLTTAQFEGPGSAGEVIARDDVPPPSTTPGLGPGGDKSPSIGLNGGSTTTDLVYSRLALSLNYVFISLILSALFYRIIISSVRYIRTLACLDTDRQLYFLQPNQAFAFIKKHVMDAPLFRKRHTEELRLSSAATSGGTLPTRLEFMLIAGTLGINIALCVSRTRWNEGGNVVLAELRNRTGVLALGNLLPLFLIANRNNPLIKLLNIPFEAFNMIHRWLGRIVALEVICHSICHLISVIKFSGGWARVGPSMRESPMILGGFMGTIAAIIILVHSPSPIRHAFYEIFLHLHITLSILFVVGVFMHLKAFPPFIRLLEFVVIMWVSDRVIRLVILFYHNVGKRNTKATIETLPGDAVRVTLSIARPWTFKPGQHIYLYIPSVGLWTSHPFAVSWSEEEDSLDPEKGVALNKQDILAVKKMAISLIVKRRTGFTDRLFQKAQAAPKGKVVLPAFVEGPYGGHHSLSSYGTVILFAAGIGIVHQVPYVRELVAGYRNDTVACRKVTLIWIIQSPEHLEWISPWMTSILSLPSRREILKIMLFVTRPRSTKEIHSPSATVQMFPGKPNVETLIELEMENQIGAMVVSVCGMGALADDVRRAVRKRQSKKNVELVEVAFSW